jgi:hypothetical protein
VKPCHENNHSLSEEQNIDGSREGLISLSEQNIDGSSEGLISLSKQNIDGSSEAPQSPVLSGSLGQSSKTTPESPNRNEIEVNSKNKISVVDCDGDRRSTASSPDDVSHENPENEVDTDHEVTLSIVREKI